MILGLGTGIAHMPKHELQAMWAEWGDVVRLDWHRQYGREPWVFHIAVEEGW